MDSLIGLVFTVLLLTFAYLIGSSIERKHFADIRRREAIYGKLAVVTFPDPPAEWDVARIELVQGSVVISLDYFKRFLATLRALIGGRIKAYEPLLDRARREALLRMSEDAVARGCHAVINVRLETSRLANARRDGKGISGVEMLAFGTALELNGKPSGTAQTGGSAI